MSEPIIVSLASILAIAIGHTCMFTRSAPVSGAGLVEQVKSKSLGV